MPILPLALPTGTSTGRQPHAGTARIINGYAEASGDDQKSSVQIWAAPGLDLVASLGGTGGGRGLIEVDGVAYAVFGRSLYRIDGSGTYTLLGGIPSDGFVGMARNQRAVAVETAVVCDGLGWIVNTGTMTAMTDPDLPPPIDVCAINRSFVYAAADGRMARSEVDSGAVIDGLSIAVAEAVPDGLYRVLDRGGDLIAIGPRSYEVWTDNGGEAFGFSRSYVVRVGAVGAKCVTKCSVLTDTTVTDTVAWIASEQTGSFAGVVMLDGYTPRKISELWVDRLIDAVTDKSSIIASSYVSRGHGFVSFRLPTTTVVYNTTTRRWHERQSRSSNGRATTFRAGLTTALNGNVLAIDATEPKLYWLDEDAGDDAGSEMVVTVRTPVAHAFPNRIEMSQLYLDMVPGVGLVTGAGQDVNPVVSMRLSRDGETWSEPRDRAIGAQGQRQRRVSWSALGTFDAVAFEFSCSANVVRGFMQAKWDGRVLPP